MDNGSDPGGPEIQNTERTDRTDRTDTDRVGTQDAFILFLLASIILLAFYFWLTYNTVDSILLSDARRTGGTFYCASGSCPIDQATGEKMCPDSPDPTPYNITTQFCSAPNLCTASPLPFAINSDRSTNLEGVCQEDPVNGMPSECRCSRLYACSEFITTAFATTAGNPYVAFDSSRTAFTQLLSSQYGGTLPSSNGSIQIGDPSTSFCQVPISWLARSSPGCGWIPPNTPPIQSAIECTQSNPCLQGTLAYITDDSTAFNFSQLLNLPVACVAAERIDGDPNTSCSGIDGTVPVFDTSYGGINCVRVT